MTCSWTQAGAVSLPSCNGGFQGAWEKEVRSAPSSSSAILSSLIPEGHFFGLDVTFSSKTGPARIHLHSYPAFQQSPLGTVAGNDLAGNSASFPFNPSHPHRRRESQPAHLGDGRSLPRFDKVSVSDAPTGSLVSRKEVVKRLLLWGLTVKSVSSGAPPLPWEFLQSRCLSDNIQTSIHPAVLPQHHSDWGGGRSGAGPGRAGRICWGYSGKEMGWAKVWENEWPRVGEEGRVREQLEGNWGLVGEEGVMTSQGPNRKQRAYPR